MIAHTNPPNFRGANFIPNMNVSLFREDIAPVFDWHNVGKGLRHTRQPLILQGFWIYSYYTLRGRAGGGFKLDCKSAHRINEIRGGKWANAF